MVEKILTACEKNKPSFSNSSAATLELLNQEVFIMSELKLITQ